MQLQRVTRLVAERAAAALLAAHRRIAERAATDFLARVEAATAASARRLAGKG